MTKVLLVMLTLYDTPAELQAVCGERALGCAIPQGSACHIHALRPQIGYQGDFVVLGHELMHCNGWRHPQEG